MSWIILFCRTGNAEVANLSGAAVRIRSTTHLSRSRLDSICPGHIHEPEARQRHTGQTNAEFLQRLPPRDKLSHVFSQFIEFVVHILFSFLLFVFDHEFDCVIIGEHSRKHRR
jgi:hypothetical protein